MSLKGFHIVFIFASLGLTLFVGALAGNEWLNESGSPGLAGLSIGMLLLGAGLFVYLFTFLRKFRGVSSM